MLSVRCILFGMLSRKSHFMTYLRSRINPPLVFIQNTRFCFNGNRIEIKRTISVSPLLSILQGPSVKKLLMEYNIKVSEVTATGPHKTLLKGDVLNYIEKKNLKKTQETVPKMPDVSTISDAKSIGKKVSHVDIPVSSLQKNIAQQLVMSKITKPHVYMNICCKIDKVFDYIKKMKKNGVDVSVNDIIIKSAATALRKVPQMNVISNNGQITSLEHVNIAMSIVQGKGYVTPVVKNADKLTVDTISDIVKFSVGAAKKPKLQHEDVEVGSFRISNLGTLGISEYTSVIYSPEVATLAVGSFQYILEDQILVHRMQVTLSYDNAVISENEASSFLNTLKRCLENPISITCLS